MVPKHAENNPFRPTFGVEPPYLAGRDEVVVSVARALDLGVGAPGRASLITGARGIGKTVLLRGVEHAAQQRGWLVLAETANPGLVDRLIDHRIPRALVQLEGNEPKRRMSGISAGGVGFYWENDRSRRRPDLRGALSDLTELLAEHQTGVLVTVDEVQGGRIDELRELGTSIQHCFGEGRDVAFVGAGLPSAVSAMLSDDILTFLRRARHHELGLLSDTEASKALVRPIGEAGRTISPAAIDAAVESSGGYPYLIQAIGYASWDRDPSRSEITAADVEAGARVAHHEIGQLVVAPALADLSPTDREFLAAMAVDTGPSTMRDIRRRLGVDHTAAGKTRIRLIEADMVAAMDRGTVDFAAPWMRRHIHQQLDVDDIDFPDENQRKLAELSNRDREFLAAMAGDDGPSQVSELRQRLGDKTPQFVGRYRQRLIAQGLIEPAGYGQVDFTTEALREAVRSANLDQPGALPPQPGLDLS